MINGCYLMKSYVKIYGPPILKAIKALERIAVEMPEVCIMNTVISHEIPDFLAGDIGATQVRTRRGHPLGPGVADWARNYFGSSGVSIPVERCRSIISKSGESLGEHDFFFEWLEEPSQEQLNGLLGKIDEVLAPLGCYYTITTK